MNQLHAIAWVLHGCTDLRLSQAKTLAGLAAAAMHGLIERLPKRQRYRVTEEGWRIALFCTRLYRRVLRPGLAQVVPTEAREGSALRRQFDRLDQAISQWLEEQKVPV